MAKKQPNNTGVAAFAGGNAGKKDNNKDKLPSVMSFQRSLVMSDGLFFNGESNRGVTTPVQVLRRGMVGTQNINKNGSGDKLSPDEKRQEVSNPQIVDSAKLNPDATSLIVKFSIRFIDIKNALASCAAEKDDSQSEVERLRGEIGEFVNRAKQGVEGTAVGEIALRYARNILNGRWLWRNRLYAEKITIRATFGGNFVEANALLIPLDSFGDYSDEEKQLALEIRDGLTDSDGDRSGVINVTATVDFGFDGGIEVHPSQNYIAWGKQGKPDGFSKSLYCVGGAEPRQDLTLGYTVMGQAALRDQKIANALRTFDTWYPDYANHGEPIPVEPNGANLKTMKFFRGGKSSSFHFVKNLATLDPNSPDGLFTLACLIRGGVYSEGAQ